MKKSFSKYLRIALPILLILFVSEAMAQTRKGEKLVNDGRYEDAIKPLKRAFEGKSEDRKAGYLLIECYYRLQRYQDALDTAELMDIERSVDENEMILYADVLIANNDFSRAYINLARMLGEGGARAQGYKWLNKTGDLLQWDSIPTGSSVTDIQGLNTVYNEYAPYITEDGLMYVADHLTVQVLYPSAFTNQSLHLLFMSPKGSGGKFGRAKMVLKGREYYYHDGPIEKRPDSDNYAFTLREIEGILYDLKMNIFFSNLSGSEEDLIPFKYNGTFNTGHPTFTEDGNRMYFVSDRLGGYGELDIWYTDWVDGEWTIPKNAGPMINSSDNELYPKISNGRLFFSSDRRDQGYGGLDLYYVSLLSSNDRIYNFRAPINSAYDDFGVDFLDTKSGYFSSNRTTGFGGDDIYEMYFQPFTTDLDTLTFAFEDLTGTKKVLRIFDSSGNEMVGINDGNEAQSFSGLVTREIYTIETDSVFDTSLKLVAYDSRGVKVQEFNSDQSSFNIEFLEQDEFDLGQEENIDESELFDFFGEVVSGEPQDFQNVSVVLEDKSGTVLDEAKTDSTGKFLLKKLQWDQPYNLTTKGTTGEVELDVLGQSGAPITALTANEGKKNSFAYTRRSPEASWMMYTDVSIPAVFGIVPSATLTEDDDPELRVLGDSLIRICEVDEDGFIEMGSLITGHAYELIFKDSNFKLSDKLVIIDGSGDTTQTVRPDGASAFVFELMPPAAMREVEAAEVAQNVVPSEADEPEAEKSAAERETKVPEAVNEAKKPEVLVNLLGMSEELKAKDEITLLGSANNFLTKSFAIEDGSFGFSQVPLDSIYFIKADIENVLKLTSTYHGFEKAGKLSSKGLWKFDFTDVEEAEKIVSLPNIYYSFDNYTLSPESTESLDNLYGFLRQNPNQKIKMLSHTDSRGPKAYNEQLSNLRAREVVRFLIRRGIDADRLSYEGRGESQPVNECSDGTYCTNDKHAENRRTEFVLIKN
jgi:outer membrane protein OmpA-like peptidoglycan-associated protein/tetratricopeptide (TPR) repeat protein